MKTRAVTSTDLAAIRVLNEASVPAVSPVTAAGFEWFLETASYFRLIELEQRLAGFLLGLPPGLPYRSPNYRWFSERYPQFCYIDRLAVDDRFRRRGVASALYADIERHARAQGAPLLACEVNLRPRNDASLAFHQAHGFSEVGQQDTDRGDKRVSLLVKPLAASAGHTPESGPA